MQHLFRQLTQPEKSGNNLSMMLFALVEVVMIVVGIVMANNLKNKRKSARSPSVPRCCLKKCCGTLKRIAGRHSDLCS